MELKMTYRQHDFQFQFCVASILDGDKELFRTNNMDVFRDLLKKTEIKVGMIFEAYADDDSVVNRYKLDKRFEFKQYKSLDEVPHMRNECVTVINKEHTIGYICVRDEVATIYYTSYDFTEDEFKALYTKQYMAGIEPQVYKPVFVMNHILGVGSEQV